MSCIAAIPAFASLDRDSVADKPAVLGGPPVSGALMATTSSAGLLLSHHRFPAPARRTSAGTPPRAQPAGQRRAAAARAAHRDGDPSSGHAGGTILLAAGGWHGSQEDLARTLGLSRVTVNRALGRLATAGAARTMSGEVGVVDANRLAAQAVAD
jgi:CRP/FNR family transcriptional regulator, cyclic AMP receptor protein